MAKPGKAATDKILQLLTSTPGVNTNLDTIAQLEQTPLAPLTGKQIRAQNISFELSERNAESSYPAVYVYCDKVANLLTEKFRSFSGKAHMVVEVRISQDRMDALESVMQLYVEAITQILEQNQGDWGQGMFYTGSYEVTFGPVKQGGRNFIQIAKIIFEVGASSN
jgi:hypothetical protein